MKAAVSRVLIALLALATGHDSRAVAPEGRVGKLRGVIVGVGKYSLGERKSGRFEDFPGAGRAAREVKKTLEEHLLKVGEPDLALLVDDGEASARPTVTNVLNALHARARASGPNDTLVFYFTGHGEQSRLQGQALMATGAVDGQVGDEIPLSGIRALMDSAPAGRKLVFLDTCRVNPVSEPILGRPQPRDAFSEAADKEAGKWKKTAIFFSSSSGMPSRVNTQEGVGFGYFTQQLLLGLGGEADLQGAVADNNLHLQELAMYLKKSVPDVTSRKDLQGIAREEEQVPVVMFESNEDYVLAKYRSVTPVTSPEIRRRQALRPPGLEIDTRSGVKAKVFIDEEFRDYTPSALSLEGTHVVRVSAQWHHDWVTKVRIGPRELKSVSADLKAGSGGLALAGLPAKATVLEDGKVLDFSKGARQVPAGPHTLTFKHRHYVEKVWHGNVPIGQTVEVDARLEPRPTTLIFTPALPAAAEVRVDGKLLTGPAAAWTVPVGARLRLELSAPDHETHVEEVVPVLGEPTRIKAALKRGRPAMVAHPAGSFLRATATHHAKPSADAFRFELPATPGGLAALAAPTAAAPKGRVQNYPAFKIDRFPVTESAYEECVKRGVCAAAPPTAGDVDGPRMNVRQLDAVAFCRDRGLRLPYAHELLAVQRPEGWTERWRLLGNEIKVVGLQDLRAPVISGLEIPPRAKRPAAPAMIEIVQASAFTEWGEWASSPSGLVEGEEVGLPPDDQRDLKALRPANLAASDDVPVHVVRGSDEISTRIVGKGTLMVTFEPLGDRFDNVGFRCASSP
jgi:hypothetical protein